LNGQKWQKTKTNSKNKKRFFLRQSFYLTVTLTIYALTFTPLSTIQKLVQTCTKYFFFTSRRTWLPNLYFFPLYVLQIIQDPDCNSFSPLSIRYSVTTKHLRSTINRSSIWPMTTLASLENSPKKKVSHGFFPCISVFPCLLSVKISTAEDILNVKFPSLLF
jgi:hypothetical protein